MSELKVKRSCRKKQRQSTKPELTFCKNLLNDFIKNTSIHGVRYVGDSNLPSSIRILWFIIIITSIVISGICIQIIYQKSHRNPILISYSNTEMDISEVCYYLSTKK